MSLREDPVLLVRLTSFIDLFPTYSTCVRTVCTVTFCLVFLAHMFGIYIQYFYENHQDMHLVRSIGTYWGATYLLYYSQYFIRLKNSLLLLQDSFKSLKSEGPKTYEYILRKFQWIKWLHITTVILISAAAFAATFTGCLNDTSTFNAIVAISGKWYPIMQFLLVLVTFIMVSGAQSVVALNNYMSFNIGAQFTLLQHFIKRTLHVKCDIHNRRQQEEIFESLKEFVKSYNTTSCVSNYFMEQMTSLITMSFLPGVITFAIFTYAVLTHENLSYSFLFIPTAWIVAAFNFPLAGQVVTDESSKIYDIMYDCPWYDWNQKNRKTLIFILTNIKEPITLHFMKQIFIDYSFIIKFYRMSYAIITFFLNMRN